MVSVTGLLKERELGARVRVEGLREQRDRIVAELAEAERDWQGWMDARQRVDAVLSDARTTRPAQGPGTAPETEDTVARATASTAVTVPAPLSAGAPAHAAAATGPVARASDANGPATPAGSGMVGPAAGSVVPVWRAGIDASVLAADYQRILGVLAEREAVGGTAVLVSCQDLAAGLGLALSSGAVEGVRSKAKRLVARGWAAEPVPGRFTLPGGGRDASS